MEMEFSFTVVVAVVVTVTLFIISDTIVAGNTPAVVMPISIQPIIKRFLIRRNLLLLYKDNKKQVNDKELIN